MANLRSPNDPYRSADDPYRSRDDPYRSNDEIRRQARLDSELQADPELAEGPVSGGRIAMFAIAIALVLGAVFYGLNSSSINQAGTSSTAQNTSQTSPPAAPPGMRDVTPRANTDQSTTTGAAPARPQTPPATATAPTGTEINRSGNPPTNNAPTSK
jgi:cytoskeletal protein RodZ